MCDVKRGYRDNKSVQNHRGKHTKKREISLCNTSETSRRMSELGAQGC